LPSGITLSDLQETIKRSGYPFQASIANVLREYLDLGGSSAGIQEEWTYVDSEASQVRSIDIFAEANLLQPTEGDPHRVTPLLNMLVECKQSDMPYVFFLRANSPKRLYDFPEIIGLPTSRIFMVDPKGPHDRILRFSMDLPNLLEIWDFPFFDRPALFGISVSKLARRPGGKLELTGEEAYRSLTLPLLKACDHLKNVCRPSGSDKRFRCRMVICLVVLRAPMFGVIRSEDGEDLISPVPWVRMNYLEPSRWSPESGASNVRYYDVVHEGHLATYMAELIEGARSLAERIDLVADFIADGKALAKLEDNAYRHLRPITDDGGHGDVQENSWYVFRTQSGLSVRGKSNEEENQSASD
jgi:hypothetical protein